MNDAAPFWEQWSVEFESGLPVYRQIVNLVSAAVASGQLHPGDRLPTIRALHQSLGVNPNTVAKAYRELELKGVITGERGNGSYVQERPLPPRPSAGKRRQRLEGLYQRLVAEAAGCGVAERDLLKYLNQRISCACDHGST
ncbi:MAG: GntR family transcriptional regulator [Verrucomicrobia bacterium]|nr:GntR family transcriptional regulator [Verrucomicrobiota bacterium]